MNESHLNFLIQLGDNDQRYVGNNSYNWASSVVQDHNIIDISLNKNFNRYDLFDYCKEQNHDHLNVLLAVLSWGGMRRNYGRSLLNKSIINYLFPLVHNLRTGLYQSRKAAFNAFQQERNKGHLPGLGIGYFTKLICFLSPALNGYIMDQWVSKSINLLTGRNIVDISNNSWVNDRNDADTYEIFCSQIDQIAQILNCDGFEAEMRLFSVGRGKGQWRNYLIKNYQ